MLWGGGRWVDADTRVVELERRSKRLHEAVTSEALLRVKKPMRSLTISETLAHEITLAGVYRFRNESAGDASASTTLGGGGR